MRLLSLLFILTALNAAEPVWRLTDAGFPAQWEITGSGKVAEWHNGTLNIYGTGTARERMVGVNGWKSLVLPERCTVEFEAVVTARKDIVKDNHFGFNVDGSGVVFRQWSIRGTQGDKGNFFTPDQFNNNFRFVYRVESTPEKLRVYADGRLLLILDKEPDKRSGKLGRIWAYDCDVSIENFRVYKGILSDGESPNLLLNSSFENVTNKLPDSWGTDHWGNYQLPWRNNMAYFRECWSIDGTAAYEGNNSFRISCSANTAPDSLELVSCSGGLIPDTEYTLSAYIRTSVPEAEIVMRPNFIKDDDRKFTFAASGEWQRVSVMFRTPAAKNSVGSRIAFIPRTKGAAYWIDAVQLEPGNTATAYRRHRTDRMPGPTRPDRPVYRDPVFYGGEIRKRDDGKFEAVSMVKNRSEQALEATIELLADKKLRYSEKVYLEVGAARQLVREIPESNADSIAVEWRALDEKGNPLSMNEEAFTNLAQSEFLPEWRPFAANEPVCFRVADRAAYRVRNSSGEIILDGTITEPVLNIGTLAPGKYRLETEVSGIDFRVAGKSDALRQINLWNQAIRYRGRDLYLWGNVTEQFPDAPWLDYYRREAGFNFILMFNTNGSAASIRAMKAVLDACGEHDMLSTISTGVSGNPDQGYELLEELKSHPAVLAAFLLDESASRGYPKDLIRRVGEKITSILGEDFPVIRNENDYGLLVKSGFEYANIASLDHYTVPERDLGLTASFIRMLKQQAGPEKLKLFIGQSTGNAYSYHREPTRAEHYCAVYQALANGIWHIVFFANTVLHEDNFAAIRDLKGERDKLVGLGVPGGVPVRISCDAPELEVSATRVDDKIVIITVNREQYPVNARLSIAQMPENRSHAEVLFEDRTVEIKDRQILDRFAPMVRHVYIIK